jgi:2-polyprenyl-3-methyl-5-hydroxy-6-metoxy-1,4-benzoquinol methylase
MLAGMTASVADRMTANDEARRDEFAARLNSAILSFADLLTVYLGDRLGLYQHLQQLGASTAAELAERAGVHPRYTREWLEQQAVNGVLDVVNPTASADERRFALSDGHAEVLLDRDSLSYMAPLTRLMLSTANTLPRVIDAFRSGGGVAWSEFGDDAREGQADGYRPIYMNLLGREWLPAVPALDVRLRAAPPARVADFGCGAGWGSIAVARAYPEVRVDGFDLDAPSIELARDNAQAAGLGDRVQFHVRDAAESGFAGQYDLVVVLEALHDMSRPVEALQVMRGMLAPGGAVLVVDEKVAEKFTAPGDDVERLMYGFSVLCCLPAGLSETPSAGTGTVMRPATLRRYAREAGFRSVDILPIEHDFFRLYLLSA